MPAAIVAASFADDSWARGTPPVGRSITVVPSDTDDLTYYTRGLYVGVAGDISVLTADGTAQLLKAVPVGYYPFALKRIKATLTTATNMVAFY